MSKANALNGHYPWYVRAIFWLQHKHYGEILNSARIWAKSPKVFLALSCFYGTLDRKKSPIPPHLRSLIIVRVSQLNGCSFCVDLNTSVLLERGIRMEKASRINEWKKSGLFDPREKAVLEYTESLTTTKSISKSLKKKMHQFYSPEEVVEITAFVAFQNMSTLFNNAFKIQPQGFCRLR